MTRTAWSLIDDSVRQDRIVTVEYEQGLADALRGLTDNAVRVPICHSGIAAEYEYWGVDDEGNPWRVHLTQQAESDDDDDERS